jgi:hypothetical protein
MDSRSPLQSRRITAAVLVLVAVVATAWLLDFVARGSAVAESYRVTVSMDSEELAVFSLDDLRAIESRRVVMQGQVQEGPPLLAVLRAAGVDRFDTVVIRGMGLRDEGILSLKNSEVDEDVLLDYAIRGTVKLCGPDIAWGYRVRDVEEIEVQ